MGPTKQVDQGDFEAPLPRENESKHVNQEVVGASTSGSADASLPRRLYQVEGRVYESPSAKVLFHPLSTLLVSFATYGLTSFLYFPGQGYGFMMATTMAGCLPITFTFTWVVASIAEVPKWQAAYIFFLNFAFQFLMWVRMRIAMQGLVLGPIVWAATTWCGRCGGQQRILATVTNLVIAAAMGSSVNATGPGLAKSETQKRGFFSTQQLEVRKRKRTSSRKLQVSIRSLHDSILHMNFKK